MKTIVECSVCEKKLERETKHVKQANKNNWEVYCSKECRIIKQSNFKILKCYNCECEIKKTPSEIKRSKSGNMFCSRKCATTTNNKIYKSDQNHPNYTNGSSSYRKRAIKKYGPICIICKYNVLEILEVHHIDGDRNNNSIKNLIVVCPTHHKEYQLGIRK